MAAPLPDRTQVAETAPQMGLSPSLCDTQSVTHGGHSPDTRRMKRSAKGTVGQPRRNVKAKSGLNHAILASGRGALEHNLSYKAGAVVQVPAPCMSQTGCICGHMDQHNRISQAYCRCLACGFTANADHNATVNILCRHVQQARGMGATARRGVLPPCPSPGGKSTPATRDKVVRGTQAPGH